MSSNEKDGTLLTPKRSCLDSPKTTKQLPRLSRWAHLVTWTRRRFRRHTRAWWMWEISAAVVSLVAMVILFSVLAQADQKLQQSWAVAGTQLTLNTIVAAIGTIMRTSLYIVVAGALNQSAWNWFAATDDTLEKTQLHGRPLKDLETIGEAASNSWNCLKLLWRTRCRYLMSIGAIVMILTIGFDTFLQQVLSTGQQPFWIKQDNRNLTVHNIIPRFHIKSIRDLYQANATAGVEFQALGSIWLVDGGSTTTPPTCPGDRCTWPVTPTIGICSECDYVTPAVHHSSNNSCANITTYSLDEIPAEVTVSDCGVLGQNSKSTEWKLLSLGVNSIPLNHSRADLLNLYLFGTDIDFKSGPTIRPFSAYRCTISFCIQGFQAHADGGRTIQTPTETRSFDFQQASDSWNYKDMAGKFIDIPTELNVKAGDQFRLTQSLINSIRFFSVDFLKGQGAYSTRIDNSEMSDIEGGVGGMFWERRLSLEDVTRLVENFVSGMTSYVRSKSNLPADPYYAPSVERQLSIVIVRWPWLCYPLFLQISGLAFLFLTMRETRRRHVLAWKGHRVALLLANLDESLRTRARGGLGSRTGLDDRVGEALVQLDFDGEDGIVFRRVDSPLSKEVGLATHGLTN